MMTKKELQKALNDLSNACNVAFMYREALSTHCVEVYGYDPADIDFDAFIDKCDGAMGISPSMSVDEFIKGMEEGHLDE